MMENLLTVAFEAHNSDLNHHRRYEISVGIDLFGASTVTFRYGRAGRSGQEMRHASADPIRLKQLIQQCLTRRLSAPKRIGCRYALVELDAIDQSLASQWLPAGFMSQFGNTSRGA